MATQLNNWLSIDKTSGTGNAEITLTASSYNELVERAASLKIQAQSINAILNVKQKAESSNDYFWVEFEEIGGAIQFVPKHTLLANSNIKMSYSFDGNVWTDFNVAGSSPTIEMGDHKKIYLYNKSRRLFIGGDIWYGITIKFLNKNCKIGGDASALAELGGYAFHRTFYGNNLLTDASALILPWDRLEEFCFESMFSHCRNLQYAPQLPATTLAKGCYEDMFSICTSLTTAPILPATTLVQYCYMLMFGGCSNLNHIEMYATDISADSCLSGWVGSHSIEGIGDSGGDVGDSVGVAPTGLFVKKDGVDIPIDSPDGIPTGWTVRIKGKPSNDYFWIEFEETGGVVSWSVYDKVNIDIQYSFDGYHWETMPKDLTKERNSLSMGDNLIVHLRNTTKTVFGYEINGNVTTFFSFELDFNSRAKIGGNMSSMTDMYEYCLDSFIKYGNTTLTDASELILPWDTVDVGCYCRMFSHCTNLVYPPQLPATIFRKVKDGFELSPTDGCYADMFYGCTSLTSAPELPATTLADDCYNEMFCGCTSLTTAPELPATTLGRHCYWAMFRGCTSLTKAPSILPCTDLGNMYDGGDSYYQYMFNGCTSLRTAPVLPAKIVGTNNYANMFYDCTSLNYIKVLATEWAVLKDWETAKNWVYNVAPTGTFVKAAANTDIPIDSADGIPSGWTVRIEGNPSNEYFWIEFEDVGGSISDMDKRFITCEYSFDGVTWKNTPNTLSMGNNTLVYFRGNGGGGYENRERNVPIKMNSVKAKIGGDITSIFSKMDVFVCEVMFRDCTNLTDASELILPWATLDLACYEQMFKGCTSLVSAPQLPATTLAERCYSRMFENCTSLVNAPALPATTLVEACYSSMFIGCTNLTTAPELPATTLAINCYGGMFENCASLTSAPILPATTLEWNCYSGMFSGCTSLTSAPQLPATTLDDNCYAQMFNGCSSLTTAPELPATTLARDCYGYMFWKCTSLTSAPELPATTLADDCYNEMFCGCTSLTTAPELPATTLTNSCYRGMFYNCTSLVNATELPATTLADGCYDSMFYGCTSLTSAPELPATTLADSCYGWMFLFCTSLTTAPVLPAATLTDYCYKHMFASCTSLNYIKMLATNISAEECLYGWVDGLSQTGTFVKHTNNKNIPIDSVNGIPSGWTVYNEGNPDVPTDPDVPNTEQLKQQYFWIEFEEVNGVIRGLTNDKTDMHHSFDGVTWETTPNELSMGENRLVYFRNDSKNINGLNIKFNSRVKIGGDMSSMTDMHSQCCRYLFRGNTFNKDTYLTDASELILPWETSAVGCYQQMFANCTALSGVPQLPATNLNTDCYQGMFENCANITTAPVLPATTLGIGCYWSMFAGCTKLNYVKMMATDVSAKDCLLGWVNNVATTGTFVKHPDAVIPSGSDGIPDGWTVETATV